MLVNQGQNRLNSTCTYKFSHGESRAMGVYQLPAQAAHSLQHRLHFCASLGATVNTERSESETGKRCNFGRELRAGVRRESITATKTFLKSITSLELNCIAIISTS